jgi:hypothetical protein
MKRRNGTYNSKRQLADLRQWPLERLKQLGERLHYGGNPEHKRNPGDFGLTPPSGARIGKMLCDDVGIFHSQEALELLRSGVAAGLTSERCVNGWPQNIWAVRDGRVLEAQLEQSETGTYHGYPLQPEDPFTELVLQRLGDEP